MIAVLRKPTGISCPAFLLLLAWVLLAPMPAAANILEAQAAAWVANDATTLHRAAPRLVDGAVSPPFDAMDRRVTAYSDWVFGWLTSLFTAWDLAYVGTTEAAREIYDRGTPDPKSVHDRLALVVVERFEDTVVLPTQTARSLDDAWQRTMVRLVALDSQLAAARRARIERLAAQRAVDPQPALERYGNPLLSATLLSAPPPPNLLQRAMLNVDEDGGGTTDQVLVRSLRPLATRTISVVTRLLLAPVVGGLVASPVANVSGIGTAIATLAAVSAGIWGLDFTVNRIDSAVSRPAFEAGLRRIVQDAHTRASSVAREQAAVTVCAAMTAAVGCPGPSAVAAPSATR
ncbi:hypothetical protein BAL199_24129 [alpha proteobacterium BAL199]|nr:hypothetical protein BAL199_24129 [alpha proteobacterium BAL199]